MSLYVLYYSTIILIQSYKRNFDFFSYNVKEREKKLKILSSKPNQIKKETMPLKLFFHSSRYLNRSPRYNDSKFQ